MKVNRFTAPTMAEALKQVKATLGAEAVILETTEAPGQVTVTAAVDLDAPGTATYRLGAALELERYAHALGAEVRRAADPAALIAVLGEPGRTDLVLVDTAGAGPAQPGELDELKGLIEAAGTGAGRTLVVSAA